MRCSKQGYSTNAPYVLHRFVKQTPYRNVPQSFLSSLTLLCGLNVTYFIMLPLPYLLEEQPFPLFEPPRRQGKILLARILARWNHPSDILTFHCHRNFAPAFAAYAAAAFAAAAFVAAASRRGVAALFRVAAAVIKLVAAAGSPLSYFAMAKVSGIVTMKVVAGVVTVGSGAAGAGLIRTSVQM